MRVDNLKIIEKIKENTNKSLPGNKICTFQYEILKNATLLKDIKAKEFMSKPPKLKQGYLVEYNKIMKLAVYLQDNPLLLFKNCDLCNKVAEISFDTWERINFAWTSTKRVKVCEVTLTENLLYELNKFSKECKSYKLDIFEAIDESTNGNDIEMYLEINKGEYIFIPMQAKILSPSERYAQIPYKKQTDALIYYASKYNGYPMYLLYNYLKTDATKINYGCSIVSAQYIKDKIIGKTRCTNPSFDEIHNTYSGAMPFEDLFCNISKFIEDIYCEEYKLYKRDEIPNDELYQPIGLNENHGSSESTKSKKEDNKDFSPGTRMIISKDKQ
jgi:hypothetical protein